jgi:hypothetical protein
MGQGAGNSFVNDRSVYLLTMTQGDLMLITHIGVLIVNDAEGVPDVNNTYRGYLLSMTQIGGLMLITQIGVLVVNDPYRGTCFAISERFVSFSTRAQKNHA